AGGRAKFLQAVLRAEQREPGNRRRFQSRKGARAGAKIFWAAEARRGCAKDQGAYAADCVRTPCSDSRHRAAATRVHGRSEEHTSELQSRGHLVCRLLLEKKKRSRRG